MASTSALRPGTTLHPDRNTHTHKHYTGFTHADANTYRTHAHKNTHVHTLLQTLAAGMAMCTNTPTVTQPLNLRRQKPRATTSLSAVKPRNYDKPLSVFILPFLTGHYRHHLPCSHLAKHIMCRISLCLPPPQVVQRKS